MLTISRDDISSTEITEFPVEDRFIKLPIENYLKLLTWEGKSVWDETNDPQIALINAINNPKYRFVVAAYARRLGKTFIANIIAQLIVLIPDCNVLIMSPNYSLSSISFELQRKLIKQFDLELTKDNTKDRVIELSNGSSVRMGSVNTVDSCVGRSYQLVLFDEAALEDGEAAFNVSLRPTLDKPNSKAIFISTPRGKNNWFAKFYNRGFSTEHPEWVALHADCEENTRLTERDILEAKASMTEAEFLQEYYASFNVFEGQIYKLPKDCIAEYVPGEYNEMLGGLDPGYKDPTALVIISYDGDCFHIVDEYQESEKVTSEHAASISEKLTKWDCDTLFIDPAGAQFAADLAYSYDIATIKAKKNVLEGIAYVQTLVENGKVKVAPHCTHTLAMFDQYKWDDRPNLLVEKPKHDQYSHIADAVRYAIYTYTL